jgi:hypothetical protein
VCVGVLVSGIENDTVGTGDAVLVGVCDGVYVAAADGAMQCRLNEITLLNSPVTSTAYTSIR